jgi:hypothetical protein
MLGPSNSASMRHVPLAPRRAGTSAAYFFARANSESIAGAAPPRLFTATVALAMATGCAALVADTSAAVVLASSLSKALIASSCVFRDAARLLSSESPAVKVTRVVTLLTFGPAFVTAAVGSTGRTFPPVGRFSEATSASPPPNETDLPAEPADLGLLDLRHRFFLGGEDRSLLGLPAAAEPREERADADSEGGDALATGSRESTTTPQLRQNTGISLAKNFPNSRNKKGTCGDGTACVRWAAVLCPRPSQTGPPHHLQRASAWGS